jgi:hypothetical protein
MLGAGTSLVDLVEAARERALARYHDYLDSWLEEDELAVTDKVCLLCLGGQFAWARNVAYPHDLYIPEEVWRTLAGTEECPIWAGIYEVVDLAERIDSFLATLESDRLTAPLARDCRADLDLLLVLGDWCMDRDRPLAAAEARHLHALACALSS